jgi:hypothetical protein
MSTKEKPMNKFVKTLIFTREDGHYFYPYREQSEILRRTPTKEDIRLFVEATVELTSSPP